MSIIFDALQKTQKERGKQYLSAAEVHQNNKVHLLKLLMMGLITLGLFVELIFKPISLTKKSHVTEIKTVPSTILVAKPSAPLIASNDKPSLKNMTLITKPLTINDLKDLSYTIQPPKENSRFIVNLPLKMALARKIKKMLPAEKPKAIAHSHHFVLNGVLVIGGEKIAMINNHEMHLGETISDEFAKLKMTDISENSVQLKDGDHLLTLNVDG